jgi:Carboxypeptidase regulatory-like domain
MAPFPKAAVQPAYTRIFRALAMLFFAFLVSGRIVHAQATTSVRGTVTDPSGSAVVGANVVLANAESRTERAATTGTQGEYQFLFLAPGTYTLRVKAMGFAGYEQKGLQLLVNTPATENVQLKLGQTTESVTVTSEAPPLNMVDASLGNSFDETQVKQIPIEARNVPELLSLQPGVAYTGNRPDIDRDNDTRNGSVNGARSDQSNVSLDGVDVNDQSNGYAFTSVLPVTVDSVEEFRVTTTNYGADQGQGSGAQVTLVTKSGTNTYHGSAYEYLRNTITSANDFFIKQAELTDGQPNKPLKLIRNIFGGSLGGPIKKDRLFFFANYEGTRVREEQSAVRAIPSATLRDGIIEYPCQNPALCPGGNVTGISNTVYAVQPGNFALNHTQLRTLDPLSTPCVTGVQTPAQPSCAPAGYAGPVGPNPVMLNYFNTTYGAFLPNDSSVGDGLNYSGFRFRAPVSLNNNVFIARVDYHLTANGKHLLFWRGALQNLNNPQAPFLPGTSPEQTVADHSKGFVVGYTAVISNSLANTFHWGYTRQSTGFIGNTNQQWNTFTGLDQGLAYSHNLQLPVNNLNDDFSWTKGNHALQFGTNIGLARNPRLSSLHSWNQGLGFTSWMSPTGFANAGSPLDPVNGNYPQVRVGSELSYDEPMLGLLGMVSDVRANYNFDKSGNLIPEGTPIKRDYGLNWYEFYGQDSWRIKPNLTLTYGLRWSLFPPPWEVNGFQAGPTVNTGKFFDQNVRNMRQGIGYDAVPPLAFGLSGAANNGPGFYNFEKTDFSPRVSIAYSPRFSSSFLKRMFGSGDKTVIRAGFSKVYDRAGLAIINTFDANAPAGLSTTLQNPCCVDGAGQVARIAGLHTIPTVDNATPPHPYLIAPPTGGFPVTPASGFPFGEAIAWGVDSSIKTPYSYAVDFSIGRELPKRFSLQLSYVGRYSHRLLTQRDLMQPLDIVDPKSGIDYNTAATRMSQLVRQYLGTGKTPSVSQINSALGSTAAYWQNLIPTAPKGGVYTSFVPGCSVTTPSLVQEIYTIYSCFPYVEVLALGWIDYYGGLADGSGNSIYFGNSGSNAVPGGVFLNNQFSSLYAWSSVGNAGYNAFQASLRKQISSGLQFDFNYTFSKSIDITSAATRVGYNGGLIGSSLPNAFAPGQYRGVSDFDTTHQINANWIADLPFGRGQRFGRNSSSVLDAIIGGWQVAGLTRWTTGFPVSVDNGQSWPTDWNYQGLAQMLAKPATGVFTQPNGAINIFSNPASVRANDFTHPFPGQSGSRNIMRGPGFASWDMSLSKRWKMPFENNTLQFRWEVYNVANLKRFNIQSNAPSLTQTQSFGDYTGLLTQPRVMEFALRYDF